MSLNAAAEASGGNPSDINNEEFEPAMGVGIIELLITLLDGTVLTRNFKFNQTILVYC
jgi:hypothetical protein